MIELTENFFNKVCIKIDSIYFPTVKYYRDDKNCEKVHYATELFNNGCLTYDKYIKRLSKACKESEENIEKIVKEFLTIN
jgi:hypothetical protein